MQQPIVGKQYMTTSPVTLIMREKTFSSNYDIKDTMGRVVFTVKNNIFCTELTRYLCEPNGTKLLKAHRNYYTFHNRSHLKRADGSDTHLADIKQPEIWFVHNTQLRITCPDGQVFEAIGDYWTSGYVLKNATTGQTIATMHRDYASWGDLYLRQDTYGLKIEAGVDLAFAVGLMLVFDMIAHHKQRLRRESHWY